MLQRASHTGGDAVFPGIFQRLQTFCTQLREDCSPAHCIPEKGMYNRITSVQQRKISGLRTASKGVSLTAHTALTTRRSTVLGRYGRS